jgi:hypothetical protein
MTRTRGCRAADMDKGHRFPVRANRAAGGGWHLQTGGARANRWVWARYASTRLSAVCYRAPTVPARELLPCGGSVATRRISSRATKRCGSGCDWPRANAERGIGCVVGHRFRGAPRLCMYYGTRPSNRHVYELRLGWCNSHSLCDATSRRRRGVDGVGPTPGQGQITIEYIQSATNIALRSQAKAFVVLEHVASASQDLRCREILVRAFASRAERIK